jgi:hypothetical protein
MNPTAITYEIVLKETLSSQWAEWFEGSRLERMDANHTRLCGELPDQAALHGILERVRDLNLRLVSVQVWEIAQKGNE